MNPRPLFISGGSVSFLGILPGMPHAPFLVLGAAAIGVGYLATVQMTRSAEQIVEQTEDQARLESSEDKDKIESVLKLDLLAIEVGYGLIPLVSTGDTFLSRVREIRRQIARDLGIIVPSVHITDNLAARATRNTPFFSKASASPAASFI
ncbi:MAG: FHIPEP family type III secretion protein [Pyrinomonadaceae bacterium]